MSTSFQQVVEVMSKDTLAGRALEHGQKVIVRWGDGTSSSHVVHVAVTPTSRVSIDESGGKRKRVLHRTDERAYITVNHKGFDLKVQLRGSGLFLLRDE